MSIRLEDYLENPELLKKEISLKEEIERVNSELELTSAPDYHSEVIQEFIDNEIVIPDYLLNDPEIVGYPDSIMQQEIYNWVLEHIENNSSVKDFGCGRGDIYNSIIFKGCSYVGIESKKSLINAGIKKYPGIHLIHGDYLDQVIETDYTICIGTLNDRHLLNKWKYFNETLNHAIKTTDKAVIFVLSSNMDDLDTFYDYPLNELFENLPSNLPCKVDYSKFQDIYVLVVYVQPFT